MTSESVFSPLDYLVLILYLALVAAIGLWASRGQRSTRDFFLGGRRIPWWAAGLSIIATETSALTFIGTPTQALRGDWTYLQLAFGSTLGRLAVAGLLIAAYYRAGVVTVYDYLAERFGPLSRGLASALFVVGRCLGSGVRLYGAAIALVVVSDLRFPLAISLLALVAVAYTIAGGIRSVIWTDVLQGLLLVGGGLLAFVLLLRQSGEGLFGMLSAVAASSTEAGHSKLRTFDLSLDPRQAYTLLAGLLGSAFLTLSTHGTDQDLVQRALTCRHARDGQRSLLLSALLHPPVVLLFLLVGSALFLALGGENGVSALAAEIAHREGLASTEKAYDFLFPVYIVQALPAGVRGLVIAALFAASMSSLDSAIAALSSTAVRSLWQPYVAPGRDEGYYLRAARWLSVVMGLLLAGVAIATWLAEGTGSAEQGFGILMLGLKVLTFVFPPLLGIFLLGVLTRRGSDRGNAIALLAGVAALLVVELWTPLFGGPPPFAWIWNPVLGCAITFALAATFRAR